MLIKPWLRGWLFDARRNRLIDRGGNPPVWHVSSFLVSLLATRRSRVEGPFTSKFESYRFLCEGLMLQITIPYETCILSCGWQVTLRFVLKRNQQRNRSLTKVRATTTMIHRRWPSSARRGGSIISFLNPSTRDVEQASWQVICPWSRPSSARGYRRWLKVFTIAHYDWLAIISYHLSVVAAKWMGARNHSRWMRHRHEVLVHRM